MSEEVAKEKSGKTRLVFHVIIGLIILSFGLFLGYQIYHLKTNINEVTAIQNQHEQSLQNVKQDLEQYLKSSGLNTNLIVLKEVQYLIDLADLSLNINYDIVTSIKSLELADKYLSELSKTDYINVRQALADDIKNLAKINSPNFSEIISKVNMINEQVTKLPITLSTFEKPAVQPEISSAPMKGLSWWQRFSSISLEKLKDIFIIRYHTEPVKPLLSNEQQFFTKQSIQLALEQAKWAALHRQADIYQTSLRQVTDLIAICFAYNPESRKKLFELVQALQSIDVSPPTYNISAKSYIDQTVMNLAVKEA